MSKRLQQIRRSTTVHTHVHTSVRLSVFLSCLNDASSWTHSSSSSSSSSFIKGDFSITTTKRNVYQSSQPRYGSRAISTFGPSCRAAVLSFGRKLGVQKQTCTTQSKHTHIRTKSATRNIRTYVCIHTNTSVGLLGITITMLTRNSIHRASIHSTPCFSVYVSMSLSLSVCLSVSFVSPSHFVSFYPSPPSIHSVRVHSPPTTTYHRMRHTYKTRERRE